MKKFIKMRSVNLAFLVFPACISGISSPVLRSYAGSSVSASRTEQKLVSDAIGRSSHGKSGRPEGGEEWESLECMCTGRAPHAERTSRGTVKLTVLLSKLLTLIEIASAAPWPPWCSSILTTRYEYSCTRTSTRTRVPGTNTCTCTSTRTVFEYLISDS